MAEPDTANDSAKAEPGTDRSHGADQSQAGDFRGPYGYGRPAYKPDPQASYSFNPGPKRTLPINLKAR